jgi:hypothetical protein
MLPCLLVNVLDQIKHLGKKGMSPRQIAKKLKGIMPLRKVPKLKVIIKSFKKYVILLFIYEAN